MNCEHVIDYWRDQQGMKVSCSSGGGLAVSWNLAQNWKIWYILRVF